MGSVCLRATETKVGEVGSPRPLAALRSRPGPVPCGAPSVSGQLSVARSCREVQNVILATALAVRISQVSQPVQSQMSAGTKHLIQSKTKVMTWIVILIGKLQIIY